MVKLFKRVLLSCTVAAAGLSQLHATNVTPTVRGAIRQALSQVDAVPAVSAILKKNNISVDVALNPNGETLLHMIALMSDEKLELFDALTSTNADDEDQVDFNITDNQGSTPLHNAVITNKPNLVSRLLASGAKTDIADKQDNTPRQVAEQEGYTELVEMIDEHEAAVAAAKEDPLGVGAAENSDVNLSLVLTNMIALAKGGALDPLIGRAPEITRIFEILGRRKKNNPVLVGMAGTGKTAIIEGVANLIASGNAPENMKDKTIYALNVNALLATGPDLPVYLEAILEFAKENPDAIFFADEVHALTCSIGGIIPVDMLKPALADGSLRLIGATTETEYIQNIANDMTLARRLMRVNIEEPSLELAALMAMSARDLIAEHHGVKITNTAVYSAVTMSSQYLAELRLPDKAIDLIDEAASAVRQALDMRELQREDLETQLAAMEMTRHVGKYDNDVKEKIKELRDKIKNFDRTNPSKQVHRKTIGELIAKKTGIAVEKVLQERHEKVLELLDNMKTQIFGQDEALEAIQVRLIASHAGMTDENKPLGTFMMLGPTGVGKSETAKQLAAFLFDDERNLIVLDMSEYQEGHAIAKIIGSPPGYVGFEQGGNLTSAVMQRPYSVVLFDEIEKAHPAVARLMLQILDEGRLTDSRDHEVDFSSTVIMMTTNSTNIKEDFPPEFLGRIKDKLTYNKLSRKVMGELVLKNLNLVNKRLFSKGITVQLDDATQKFLAREGYDPEYGARPLEAVFDTKISTPLSQMIVEGKLVKGKHYLLSFDENGELQATESKKNTNKE